MKRKEFGAVIVYLHLYVGSEALVRGGGPEETFKAVQDNTAANSDQIFIENHNISAGDGVGASSPG